VSEPQNARIEEARALHRRGDLKRAISLYEEVLRAEPGLAAVWHLKGMAEHQSGELAQAGASAAQAIARGGDAPAYLYLEGSVLHDRGDLEAAGERFARVTAARPEWAPGHVELGLVRMDQGRVAEALENFRAAVSADAGNARAWNNLGTALQSLDRMEEAIRAFDHTLTIDPRFARAHFNLARIWNLRFEHKRALEHAQHAARLDPAHFDAWLLVGDIQRMLREPTAALAAYGAAVRSAPREPRARSALAELLAEMGHTDQARAEYALASEHAPGSVRAALGAALLLPQVYSSRQQLDESRAGYAEGLERLHEQAARFRFASPAKALADLRWTNFYLAYQGGDDVALQRRFGEFHQRVLSQAAPEFFAPRPPRPARSRLRVGFYSHFFFNCTAGRYFSSWITHLDRDRFESFVYYTNEWVADDTRRIAQAASTFRHLPGRPLLTLARQVAGDGLDILVYPEIGMHPDTFALAGLRLAPVQCAGWGHPDTTGLPNIDWFISCEAMEPEGAQAHYSEKLALLPGLGTRYAIPQRDLTGTRADFGLPEDRTIYLVPQSLFKIHPDNDELIAQVLSRDPRGVALFFASGHEVLTQLFAGRLARAFERFGLDIHERAIFMRSNMPHPTYLRLNELCDVMIDTLHWSGGNTSLDALASGLPVVTLPGALMRGRQSAAMLDILGLPELVAADRDELVATAVRLGRDPGERRSISARIAAGRGALFEREEPVRALEEFLLRAAGARSE
jgi:predicted O-linked N-acetylglucosamine transferase (SPINDLY family)